MRTVAGCAVLIVAVAAACARAYAPPGGERDTEPPRLTATVPEALSVVSASTDPVVFRFDERLSEREFSAALVTVSPLDGAVRVDRSGREVRVSIDGGWRPQRVYRVVLLPGVRDLFGNVRRDAAELVFSTGPPIHATAIAGLVLDRVTGSAARTPVVEAVRRADTVRYVALADSAGFYSLRHVPLGVYDLRAWSDQNRNRRRDPAEAVDTGHVVSVQQEADTIPLIFRVLVPDTTPARVTDAEAIDSVHVRVTLDDHVDAGAAASASAEVFTLPDTVSHTRARSVMLRREFEARRRQERAAREDTAAAAPLRTADPNGEALPARELVVELERVLPPGEYLIRLTGLRNLSGLTGDAGARFEVRARPAARDTTAAPADTTALPRDTTGLLSARSPR